MTTIIKKDTAVYMVNKDLKWTIIYRFNF
jgi:hypothetical protein